MSKEHFIEQGDLVFRKDTWDRAIFYSDEYLLRYTPGGPKWNGDIIDIGCHIGTFSHMYYSTGTYGHIYAVEPDPYNYSIAYLNLYKGISEGKITLFNRCVSHNNQDCVCQQPSPRKYDRNTGGRVWSGDTKTDSSTLSPYKIQSINIDDIISIAKKPLLIKLDCEGCEVPFLTESNKLDEVTYIIGEYHSVQEQFRPIIEEACKKWGFKKYKLIPHTSAKNLGIFHMDRN